MGSKDRILDFWPYWIRHIWPQQRSALKGSMKSFGIVSIFRFWIGKILACSTFRKMKVKIQKTTENFQYRPHWIRHIRPQQRSVLKRTMKGFCIASIFCFCKGRILGYSTNLEKMRQKIQKMTKNLKYRQYWISHIWTQQRSVLKWSTKSFCIASIFCFCRSRNLACSTI